MGPGLLKEEGLQPNPHSRLRPSHPLSPPPMKIQAGPLTPETRSSWGKGWGLGRLLEHI